MPTVGDMKFDYTDEGIAQAEQHSMQTGIPVDYESEDTEFQDLAKDDKLAMQFHEEYMNCCVFYYNP